MAVGGTVYGDEKEKTGWTEIAAAAEVTIDQAVKTASEKVSGKVIEAESVSDARPGQSLVHCRIMPHRAPLLCRRLPQTDHLI